MIDEDGIRERYAELRPHLDERGRRLFAAVESKVAGYGGIAAAARATGIVPSTIGRGLKELYYKPPGPKTMRQGWDRFAAMAEGFRLAHAAEPNS